MKIHFFYVVYQVHSDLDFFFFYIILWHAASCNASWLAVIKEIIK